MEPARALGALLCRPLSGARSARRCVVGGGRRAAPAGLGHDVTEAVSGGDGQMANPSTAAKVPHRADGTGIIMGGGIGDVALAWVPDVRNLRRQAYRSSERPEGQAGDAPKGELHEIEFGASSLTPIVLRDMPGISGDIMLLAFVFACTTAITVTTRPGGSPGLHHGLRAQSDDGAYNL